MRYIIIALLALSFTIHAEESKPVLLTLPAINAMASYEKEIIAARKAYDLATTKASGNARDKMEKEKVSVMQKGDLDGATAIANAIKALDAGETLLAVEEKIKTSNPIATLTASPFVVTAKSIAGSYNRGVYIIRSDLNSLAEGMSGTVTIDEKKNTFTVHHASGWKHADMKWDAKKKGYVGSDMTPNGEERAKIVYYKDPPATK